MRQPFVIIWPLISPSSGAPSAMSGKSASSTDCSWMSAALMFRRLAKSFRALSTASFLLVAITEFQTTPWCGLFRYILNLKTVSRKDATVHAKTQLENLFAPLREIFLTSDPQTDVAGAP